MAPGERSVLFQAIEILHQHGDYHTAQQIARTLHNDERVLQHAQAPLTPRGLGQGIAGSQNQQFSEIAKAAAEAQRPMKDVCY